MSCPRCGSAVPSGLSICPACRRPLEFSARDREQMSVDVRARVLWGDPKEAIQDDWRQKGAPEAELQAALKEAREERRIHFRTRGAQDLATALLLFLLGAGAFWLDWAARHGGLSLRPQSAALIMVAMVGLPLAGFALAFRGIRRLLIGGEIEEAASDLSELE